MKLLGAWYECNCSQRACFVVLDSPVSLGKWKVKIAKVVKGPDNNLTKICEVFKNQLRELKPTELLEI